LAETTGGLRVFIYGLLSQVMRRQQIEEALLPELKRREEEWLRASDENREMARQRFLDVLRLLHSLTQGSTPEECH
jgi:hypothetical protein